MSRVNSADVCKVLIIIIKIIASIFLSVYYMPSIVLNASSSVNSFNTITIPLLQTRPLILSGSACTAPAHTAVG